jgi:CDP-diacylglycerol--serine O-phosphatidyltransferase
MPDREFSPRAWWHRIGPAGVVTMVSIGAAWAAIGLLITGHLKWSVLVALLAFVLDMVDGLVARRTGTASDFGRTFDSLADLINYSVWSALAAALWIAPGPWGWAVGGLIVIGGAVRLARFTVDGFDDGAIKYYRGVVTPHLTLAAMVLLMVGALVDIPLAVSVVLLAALAIAQLTGFKMRKTGRQALWASLVIPLAVGAVLWLP